MSKESKINHVGIIVVIACMLSLLQFSGSIGQVVALSFLIVWTLASVMYLIVRHCFEEDFTEVWCQFIESTDRKPSNNMALEHYEIHALCALCIIVMAPYPVSWVLFYFCVFMNNIALQDFHNLHTKKRT